MVNTHAYIKIPENPAPVGGKIIFLSNSLFELSEKYLTKDCFKKYLYRRVCVHIALRYRSPVGHNPTVLESPSQ